MGGFNALFFLLLPCIPLALWQIIRLMRFRRIPMREALPSPFGVKLGHGLTAVWLVALAQFFCFLLPLMQLLTIYTDTCLTWHKPDDPPWIQGLAVTTWENTQEIISPWKFDASGHYWLYETYGPPGNPLSRELGRVGFIPGYVPLVMVVAAGLMALALLVTLYIACRGWWLRDRRLHVIASLALLGVPGTSIGMGHLNRLESVERETDLQRDDHWVQGRMTDHLRDHLHRLIESRAHPAMRPTPSRIEELYASEVDFRGHGRIGKSRIAAILTAESTPSGEIFHRLDGGSAEWNPVSSRFRVSRNYYEYRDAADRAECSLLAASLEGVTTTDGHTEIEHERLEITPVYLAVPRMAERAEALAWARALQRLFTKADGCMDQVAEGLNILLDESLVKRWADGASMLPDFDAHPELQVFAVLMNGTLAASPDSTRVIGSQPGGRTRIAIPLHPPRKGGSRELTVDLILRDNRWRAVELVF